MVAVVGILTAAVALYAFASWHGFRTWRTAAEMYAAVVAGMGAAGLGALDAAAIVIVIAV